MVIKIFICHDWHRPGSWSCFIIVMSLCVSIQYFVVVIEKARIQRIHNKHRKKKHGRKILIRYLSLCLIKNSNSLFKLSKGITCACIKRYMQKINFDIVRSRPGSNDVWNRLYPNNLLLQFDNISTQYPFWQLNDSFVLPLGTLCPR